MCGNFIKKEANCGKLKVDEALLYIKLGGKSMQQRFEVDDVQLVSGVVKLSTKEDISVSQLQATGRMLVDSDNLAFIYILEYEDQYIYMSIPHHVWADLKQVDREGNIVKLNVNNEQVELTSFKEELAYLIENIKGNANYGDEMVEKIEAVFS